MMNVQLYNGNQVPLIGIGTYQLQNDEECINNVKSAIEQGYRRIDTALSYGNAEAVGKGIREGLASTGLNRNDIFVASKLQIADYGRDRVETAYKTTLKKLGLTYLDLYLLEEPVNDESIMVDTWQGMETLYKETNVRNIGVCRFTAQNLETLLAQVSIKPVINQIEISPNATQSELRLYSKAQKIQLESCGSPMSKKILENPYILDIAKEIGCSPVQVVLRWYVEHGLMITLPASPDKQVRENLKIFDFQLSNTQIETIDKLEY